jgi:hypothetical protein
MSQKLLHLIDTLTYAAAVTGLSVLTSFAFGYLAVWLLGKL